MQNHPTEKNKNPRFVQTKILAGYVLLILIAALSVAFVYHRITRITAPDEFEAAARLKRSLIQATLSRLYETESIGQTLGTGERNDFGRYRRALNLVRADIDSLKKITPDSEQRTRLDSIVVLLNRKERLTADMLRSYKDSETEKIYSENIEKVLSRQDSAPIAKPVVQKQTTIKHDTVVVRKKEKGFFGRLADAFRAKETDSATVTSSSKYFAEDTVLFQYNPADTVALLFQGIRSEVDSQRRQIHTVISRQSNTLQRANREITAKINRLLRDMEEEESQHALTKIESRQGFLENTGRIIAVIAVIAILVAILFLLLIWGDISKSQHYRRQLEKAKKQAEDLLVSREKLMLTITHDIKAPVGSILGYIELLGNMTDDQRQQYYLENMKGSSAHLLKLVNNLLDYHRLESDKLEVNPVPFRIDRLFAEITTGFKPLAAQKRLELNYIADPVWEEKYYTGDPFRIRQIADNLLSNAVKFTESGSVTLTVSSKRENSQRMTLVFSVADTGHGIAPEERQKIFEEFTRLPGARGAEGFGLGLSITRKLVELLKGTITLASEIGTGTTFTVSLPVTASANMENPIPETERTTARDEKTSEGNTGLVIPESVRILIVDDDRFQLTMISELLKQRGIACDTCDNPTVVEKMLSQKHYDLIVTDIQMPELNGFELVKRLRESDNPASQRIPVIAQSARADMEPGHYTEHGFSAVIAKPFTGSELVSLIASLLIGNEISAEGEAPYNEKRANDCGENSPEENIVPMENTDSPGASETLDFSSLTRFAQGDEEAIREIMRSFVSETRKNLEIFTDVVAAGNKQGSARIAHKMIPLFTMLGAKNLVAELSKIEISPEIVRENPEIVSEIESEIERILREATLFV